MSTNEPNISNNLDSVHNTASVHNIAMPPQNPYGAQQFGQHPNQQHYNPNHPNSNYQHSPQVNNGGTTNGAWSMIMLAGTILFSFIFPLLCIATAIGGMIFGHLGWRDHKEMLARVGFWINLSSIVFGLFLFVFLFFMIGALFYSM